MIPELCAAIRAKAVPAVDRVGLLADYSALARAGKVPVLEYLTVLPAYDQEDSDVVLSSLIERLAAFRGAIMSDADLLGLWTQFGAKIVSRVLATTGWDEKPDDGHLTKKLRGQAIGATPYFGAVVPEIVAEANRRFAGWCQDPNDTDALPSEYRAAVLGLCVATGGEEAYEKVLEGWDSYSLDTDLKDIQVRRHA